MEGREVSPAPFGPGGNEIVNRRERQDRFPRRAVA
jgi:hypothetical protein